MHEEGLDGPVAVLLVDDHPANLTALEAVLGRLDCQLVLASSGEEALRQLDERDFAVVLMDVQMPVLDGFETTARLRAHPQHRTTPIILMTAGDGEAYDIERGYRHGAVDFMRKPFVPEVVRYKVSIFIELFQARREVKRQSELLQRRERERADENEALLQLVIDQCGDGIIVADEGGTLRVFNNAAERQHGASKQAVSASDWAKVYGLLDLDGAPLALEETPLFKAVHGTPVHEARWQVQRPNGERRVLVGTATPLRRANGSSAGGMLITRDVTEQLALERERTRVAEEIRQLNNTLERRVRERTRELEEANKELESFTYSVSHDLRAPLRHITGFAQLLEKRASAALDDKSRSYLSTISRAAQSGGQLVDDLLAFSRLGKTELRTARVALGTLVEDVRQELSSDLETRPLTWQVAQLPDVQADPALLKLALRNLMANAVKYTGPVAAPVIEIGAQREGPLVHVWVKDNGVGFEPQYVDKLFGIFQRLHTSEQFEGVGIGLANVRRVINRHGGSVWAEGAVDQGATFHFTVPGVPGDLTVAANEENKA